MNAPRRDSGGWRRGANEAAANEGAEAAANAYRTFAAAIGGAINGAELGGPPPSEPNGDADDPFGIGELRRSMTRALDLYLELAERVFDVSTRSLEQALSRPLASLTGSREASTGPVRLVAAPGKRATATIWLHNVTSEPLTSARLVCSDLLGHDGSTLPSTSVTIEPNWSGPVAPFSTVSATVLIAVPDSAAAAVYVGHAVLIAAADVAVPLRLTVEDEPAGPL